MAQRGRRGNGEGTIYWSDARQRWVGEITVGDGKRLAHMAKTKREVQEWMNKARLAAQDGTLTTGPRQTVEQFLRAWLKDTAATRVRPSTYLRYEGIIKLHCVPGLGKVLLSKVTAQHLQRLYADKLKSGLAPATVQYIHRVLHRAFKDAMRWDLIPRNPCDLVDPPRAPQPELQVWNEEQVCRFLRVARESDLEAIYVLALTTGMREGELLGLKWQDLDGNELRVQRTLSYLPRKGFVWGEPKSKKSRRRIALGPLAIMALNRHRERQALQRAVAGQDWQEQGLVFTNGRGGPIIARNFFGRSWRPLLEKAGLLPGPLTPDQHQAILSTLQAVPQWEALPQAEQMSLVNAVAKAHAKSPGVYEAMLQAARTLAAAGGKDPRNEKPIGSIRACYRAAVKSAIASQGTSTAEGRTKAPAGEVPRFHDLRHTAATMMLTLGTHPKVVQEMLGHSAISVTMDRYSHVLPGLQEEAVDRLNARLAAADQRIADQIADSGDLTAVGGL